MRDNPRISAFLDQLKAAGILHRVLWSGKRPLTKGFDDVNCIAFVGDGFKPAIGTAMIIDYGPRDGYGFYPETRTNSMEDDVRAVLGKPNVKAVVEHLSSVVAAVKEEMIPGEAAERALLQEAVAAWPQVGTDDEINGGDMVEWFGFFHEKATAVLAAAPFDEWSMSGPEEGDQADQSVWVTDGYGNELLSVTDDVGDVEERREFGRQVAAALNAARIPSPLAGTMEAHLAMKGAGLL